MSTYLRVGVLNILYNNIDDPTVLHRCFEMCGIGAASTDLSKPKNAILPSTAKVMLSDSNIDEGSVTIRDMLIKKAQKKSRTEWTSLNKVKKLLKQILGSFDSPNYAEITVRSYQLMLLYVFVNEIII